MTSLIDSEILKTNLVNVVFDFLRKTYEGKNVFVTGGAGFIGTNLVLRLASLGAHITILDLPSADFSPIPGQIDCIKASLRDTPLYESFIKEADYIFHLAARTDLSGKTIDDYSDNYQGTADLLDVLGNCTHLKKFVYYSTQLVVGIFNEKRFQNPDEPYRTKTFYGKSKILGEQVVKDYSKKTKLPYFIFRPTSVYGPYCKVPYRDFFLTIKRGRYFHIGRADNLISMCYVKNLVDQSLYLAAHPDSDGQIFYGNDIYPYTMREFSEAVAAYYGKSLLTIPNLIAYPAAYALGVLKVLGYNPPIYPSRLKNINASYCYNIANTLRLGFVPKYELQEGIHETLNWFTQNDPEFL